MRSVRLDFLPEAAIGDYVMVHVGFAISKVDESQAKRTYELLQEMGARAHAMIKERFGQERQIDRLESFYEEAITMNGAAEHVDARPIARITPQFAERLPAK